MAARKRGLLRRMSSAVLGSARLVEEDPDPEDAASAAVLRKSSAQREQNATLERDIKEMFQCFDNDGSKQLDSDEFCDALSMLSIHLDARDMRALFDEIDTSGGGDLEMEEWETMMTRSKKLLMGRNGPRITKTEVANVVQSILVDTAHRKAVQVQSVWRGTNTRRRERRPTSVADRQRAFELRLSQMRMEREESKSASWLTHPVCWRLIQPGFKRLGIGYQDSGPAHAVDQERAYDMYQMVRPPGVREGMHQESKTVDEFAEQLYGLLLVPGTGTFSQTYGSILTVISHVNGVPCCWNQAATRRSSRPRIRLKSRCGAPWSAGACSVQYMWHRYIGDLHTYVTYMFDIDI